MVTPQNWLFQRSYKKLREKLLREQSLCHLGRLGEGGFESTAAAGAFISLNVWQQCSPEIGHRITGVDASFPRTAREKSMLLKCAEVQVVEQVTLLKNVDARIVFSNHSARHLLSEYADSYLGLGTGDGQKYLRYFWEASHIPQVWVHCQSAVQRTQQYGGREQVIAWDQGIGRVRGMSDAERVQIHNQDRSGNASWSKSGVGVALMRGLPANLYDGAVYDKSMAVLIPKNPEHLSAIWAYCSSSEFHDNVRLIDHNIIVANGTLVQVPFDLEHWQKVAEKIGPLPEPYSNDPTQWLFKGNPGSCWPPGPPGPAAARF